ncbi:MAG: hypothetical protein R2827_07950 [Bdellovibrionales bacterium]
MSSIKISEMDATQIRSNIDPYSEIWALESEGTWFLYDGKKLVTPKGNRSDISAVLSEKHLIWNGFDVKSYGIK